jgi:Uma2 family endonuclease
MVQTKQPRTKRGDASGEAPPEPRRFTVDDYYRMAEAGILRTDERLELLEGEIIEMSPIGGPHAGCVTALSNWLVPALLGRAVVRIQQPIRLSSRSEPEPDVAVVRYRDDLYRGGHPEPKDVLLIIKVADSTLAYDLRRRLPLYAAAGIPEVWIAEVGSRQVRACREPQGRRYRQVEIISGNGTLSPVAFPDLVLKVAEVFG